MEDNYELYHHGILGMKWGIRRYQNEDGSLTDAGKRRYGKTGNPDYDRAHQNRRLEEMNDAELRAVNNRLQMEAQYRQLKANDSSVMRGVAYVATAGAIMGTVLTAYRNADTLLSVGSNVVKKMKRAD